MPGIWAVNSRSSGVADGPRRSGSRRPQVRAFASRIRARLHDLGVHAKGGVVDEHAALTGPGRSVRSTPSANASSASTALLRSRPRSSAKWFRVPDGTQTYARLWRMATDATRACEPSPPAMPSTSAPSAAACSASWRRSSPGWSTIGWRPRSPASPSWSAGGLAVAGPRMMSTTPWRAEPTCAPGGHAGQRLGVMAEAYRPATANTINSRIW